jgi:hypothetical protein
VIKEVATYNAGHAGKLHDSYHLRQLFNILIVKGYQEDKRDGFDLNAFSQLKYTQ